MNKMLTFPTTDAKQILNTFFNFIDCTIMLAYVTRISYWHPIKTCFLFSVEALNQLESLSVAFMEVIMQRTSYYIIHNSIPNSPSLQIRTCYSQIAVCPPQTPSIQARGLQPWGGWGEANCHTDLQRGNCEGCDRVKGNNLHKI